MRHIGTHLFIGFNEAALVNVHACFRGVDLIAIGTTTHCTQDTIKFFWFWRCIFTFKRYQFTGVFKTDPTLRQRFLDFVNRR